MSFSEQPARWESELLPSPGTNTWANTITLAMTALSKCWNVIWKHSPEPETRHLPWRNASGGNSGCDTKQSRNLDELIHGVVRGENSRSWDNGFRWALGNGKLTFLFPLVPHRLAPDLSCVDPSLQILWVEKSEFLDEATMSGMLRHRKENQQIWTLCIHLTHAHIFVNNPLMKRS